MDAAALMSREVVTATPQTPVAEAARLMLQFRISGLPVVDDGAVVGIITEGDLLRRAELGTARRRSRWVELLLGRARLARDYIKANARQTGEVMTREVVCVAPHTPLAEVVRLMEKHRVRRLPVTEEGRLVGTVSRADLLRVLVGIDAVPAQGGDAEIRRRILAALAAEPWCRTGEVSVWVRAGIVELGGTFADEPERTALRVLVERVPGVTAVRDRLVRIEPVAGSVLPPEGSPPTLG